jgi:MFS transporter, ACS family, glucarate transporter
MNLSNPATPPTLEQSTHVRYGVLAFACSLSMITYLDRVCFGSAVSYIVADLGLRSEADLKWAITAFAFAYAVFEVPSGWLGDVYGPRNTLIRIVLWWSLFTATTGLVGLHVGGVVLGGVGVLAVVRFLFGMGEAGAYPNITRALHNWLPLSERGLGQGAVWMAGRLMGGLTPLVWALLIEGVRQADGSGHHVAPLLTWRSAFWMFGVVGTLWCLAFALWFRNCPEEKAAVNAAELDLIRAGRTDREAVHSGVPWLRLLRSGNLWALCLMYFCASYGWYFNITYLPTFLEQQYTVDKSSLVGALYKGGPLWMGAVACLAGGWLSDRFIRRTGNRRWGRRLFGVLGHGLCGLCYLGCLVAPDAFTFFLAISLAAFCNDLIMGPAWATCQDIGRRYAAIVAGCMNTVGNLGGAAAGWATGVLLERSLDAYAATQGVAVEHLTAAQKTAGLLHGYHLNFVSYAAVYAVAVVLWLRIDATKPVAPDETEPLAV